MSWVYQVSDWGTGEPADLDSLRVTSFEGDAGPEKPFYEQLARRLAQLEASPTASLALLAPCSLDRGRVHRSGGLCFPPHTLRLLQLAPLINDPGHSLLPPKGECVHMLPCPYEGYTCVCASMCKLSTAFLYQDGVRPLCKQLCWHVCRGRGR